MEISHIALIIATVVAAIVIAAATTLFMTSKSSPEATERVKKDTVVIVNEPPAPTPAEDSKPAQQEIPTYKSLIEKGAGKYFDVTEEYLGKAEKALADPTIILPHNRTGSERKKKPIKTLSEHGQ